jgi:hypothetical protein
MVGHHLASNPLVSCLSIFFAFLIFANVGCTKKSRDTNLPTSSTPIEIHPSLSIWRELIKLDPNQKSPPATVEALLNKKIQVTGFPVINEASFEEVTEFILTPISGGCVHVPLPPPNYMIQVKIKNGGRARIGFLPITITGILSLPKKKENRKFYSYEMQAEKIEIFDSN